jgi:hypothetical protein
MRSSSLPGRRSAATSDNLAYLLAALPPAGPAILSAALAPAAKAAAGERVSCRQPIRSMTCDLIPTSLTLLVGGDGKVIDAMWQ